MVPDTLDLTHYARLAINGVLGSTDPDCDYEPYFLTFMDVHPIYMIHWSSMPSGVLPKYVEALPLLRQMSGSDHMADWEKGMLASVVANCSDDGMIYDRATANRPWNSGVGYGVQGWNEDYANMAGNGRLITGFLYYYQMTGDETWKKRAQRTAERMLELAVVKDDRAYYPNVGLGNDFSYPRKSGWVHTNEPGSAQEGSEGAMLFYHFQPLRGFARWYKTSGDERFLELSRKFINFGLDAKWWGAYNDSEPLAGGERGHFWGHWHAHSAALRGILDYGMAANDFRAKEFVRDAYEWSRQHGIHRLGVFPTSDGGTEGCTLADMVGLAVALTDAGMGDYWDDVEQYARNGLLCVQATDRDQIEHMAMAGRERPLNASWGGEGDPRFTGYHGVLHGQETIDNVLERSIGAYGHLVGARFLYPRLMHCCTGNGPQGLYYAWEGIVRHEGSAADINLWLNRRSPWLDVWSWLPHEGKLVVRNKGMRRITVRLPGWTSRPSVTCTVNGQPAEPEWLGSRAVFAGLRGNEEICLTAPVTTEKTKYSIANLAHRSWRGPDSYDCEFRGHTAISIGEERVHPGGRQLTWYRLFQRESDRKDKAPMKSAAAYVHPDKLVHW
jgi:hypothetical protein